MKKIVRILAGLIMGLMCVNCASARSGNEEKVSETRSVNPFHSIEMESVASVYFTQSDTYSLRVEGEKKWVDQTKCTRCCCNFSHCSLNHSLIGCWFIVSINFGMWRRHPKKL